MATGPGFEDRSSRRVPIALACTECGARNYKTTRARREGAKPVSLSKFCKICNRHTLHVEAK